jgi:hypothetical protein
LSDHCDITRKITVAAGVFAPGHLGELTQIIDFDLVDAVAEETGSVQRRVRLLPTRVAVYFVLALVLFESCGYRTVWYKMVASLGTLALTVPSASALCRARRRIGSAPLAALFHAISGPAGTPHLPGVLWRGLRTVAIDGTSLHVRDSTRITALFAKREGFGYPLLRLSVLIETGTRSLIDAVFSPESEGECSHAARLIRSLTPGMLLLADCGYDSWELFKQVGRFQAHYLVRSGASRTPLIRTRLPDGSYLSVLGPELLKVRIIEAWITVTYQDGTVRTEQWRLITSLLDHVRYPAADLVEVYHQRWEVETTYFSIKSTILDGRVLRSDRPEEIDQEVYALLSVYQAIIRITCDAIATRPRLDPDRASFTVALETAADQVVTAGEIIPGPEVCLVGAIGSAVLANLLPVRRRSRAKARSRKNTTSKYVVNTGKHPHNAQTYTFTARVEIMEKGLTTRPRR